MRVRVLLSRLWHWWQWYWLFQLLWVRAKLLAMVPLPEKITRAYLKGLGPRKRLWWWTTNQMLVLTRYFIPTHELVIDRNSWLVLVSGTAGIYNHFWRCVHVFLGEYLGLIPNYWIVAYHHEILHSVIHQVVGFQASKMLDKLNPQFFSEYIGANTHFFTAPTLTYDQWRFGIMRRMSVAGESEVFGG